MIDKRARGGYLIKSFKTYLELMLHRASPSPGLVVRTIFIFALVPLSRVPIRPTPARVQQKPCLMSLYGRSKEWPA
jgi:hypothetical protein